MTKSWEEEIREKINRITREGIRNRTEGKKMVYSSLSEKDWGITLESLDVDRDNEETLKRIKKWKPDMQKGVLFSGPTGTGKTTICKGVINRFASNDFKCRIITCADYLQLLRKQIGDQNNYVINQEVDLVLKCDLLVLDDMGTETITDWSLERIFALVDSRINSQKHIFFTTNHSLKSLHEKYGSRIVDRIFGVSTWLTLEGKSRRLRVLKDEI